MLRLLSIILFWALAVVVRGESRDYPLYYPQAVYADEHFTIVMASRAGQKLTLSFDDEVIQERVARVARVELSLRLSSGGVLKVATAEQSFSWQLVSPEQPLEFSLQSGHLYAAGRPAILLLRHTIPPKEDRTWQVAKWFYTHVSDNRPVVEGGLRTFTTAQNVQRESVTQQAYLLDRLICTLPPRAPEGVTLLVAPCDDLRAGMTQLEYRLRLEWMFQRLKSRRPEIPLFVLLPHHRELTALGVPRELYRVATAANGVHALHRRGKDDLRRANAAIAKEVRFK